MGFWSDNPTKLLVMETAQTDSDCKTKAKPDRDSNLRNETENAT